MMAQLDFRCLLVSPIQKRMICYQLWAENEQLHHLVAEAKGSATGRRDPSGGVPPGVALLDPEIDAEAKAVCTHLEELARDAERRS